MDRGDRPLRAVEARHQAGHHVLPNKDKLGYLVAFLIGCPFLNLGCLVLFVIAQYKVAHDKRSRKAWTK